MKYVLVFAYVHCLTMSIVGCHNLIFNQLRIEEAPRLTYEQLSRMNMDPQLEAESDSIELRLIDEEISYPKEQDILDGQVEISKFKTKFFWLRPKQPFYEVDVGLNKNEKTNKTISNEKGRYLMALGFINNDQYNDLVVIDGDQQ